MPDTELAKDVKQGDGHPRRSLWRGLIINALGTLAAILVAFSIDAAWDYNSDRQRERTYLDALEAELVATRGTILLHREDLDRRHETIRHNLSTVVLARSQDVSADTVYALVGHLGPVSVTVPRRAALDDLLNSGGLQLIRSDTLRRSLAAYDEALSRYSAVQQALLDLWTSQLSPYDVAHANLTIMTGDTSVSQRLARTRFQPDLNAFYDNRTYANLLFSRRTHEGRVYATTKLLLETIDAILGELGAPLPPDSITRTP